MTDTTWFSSARFGMFVHFGLYSIPAGVWAGKRMGRNWYAEWMQVQGNWPDGIPDEEYRRLADEFNPVDFDAEEWIHEAKNAGMKYFLITSKHHDGFALWHSKTSIFNVLEATGKR
jgi:alpha-L-fucosidase